MNKRTVLVIIGLLLIVGVVAVQHWREPRQRVTLLPPTGQEPLPQVTPMAPPQPPQEIAPPEPAPPVATTPVPAPAATAPASQPRAKRFWGNRGYVIKDRQPTFIKPSEMGILKREYTSTP